MLAWPRAAVVAGALVVVLNGGPTAASTPSPSVQRQPLPLTAPAELSTPSPPSAQGQSCEPPPPGQPLEDPSVCCRPPNAWRQVCLQWVDVSGTSFGRCAKPGYDCAPPAPPIR
jgi:hypothetical protein